MNRDTALLLIRSIIEEVAEDHSIPESVAYAAMQDEVFTEASLSKLLQAVPANSSAGMPDYDDAAAQFAESLKPKALELLQRYEKRQSQ